MSNVKYEKLNKLKNELTDNTQILSILQNDYHKLILKTNTLSTTEKHLIDLISSHSCPYCKQAITTCTLTEMKNELAEIQQQLPHISKEMVASLEKQTEVKNKIYLNKDSLDKKDKMNKIDSETLINKVLLENQLQKNITTKKQLEADIGAFKDYIIDDDGNKHLPQLRLEYLDMNKQLSELTARSKQIDQLLLKLANDIKDENDNINNNQTDLKLFIEEEKESEIIIAGLNFWDKAFDKKSKKILDVLPIEDENGDPVPVAPTQRQIAKNQFITMRSYMLEQSIDDLNKILKDYYNLLGPNSLPISFDNNLMIREDFGKRSAGQRRRNHLVIFFSLFELVRQQSRFLPNFLMLDEVFDAIDKLDNNM